MKTSFKIIKNLFLGLALLAFFLAANQAYALGSTPVKVVNPDEIAEKVAKAQGIQHPFQATIYCDSISDTQCMGILTLPENQRLVIEYISTIQNLPIGFESRYSSIQTIVDGQYADHVLKGGDPNPYGTVSSSQMVRIYADPGTKVTVRSSGKGNSAIVTYGVFRISGQLIDVP